MALPSEISEGDTRAEGGLATTGTVSVSQTIDPGETLSDVATSLVADLSGDESTPAIRGSVGGL